MDTRILSAAECLSLSSDRDWHYLGLKPGREGAEFLIICKISRLSMAMMLRWCSFLAVVLLACIAQVLGDLIATGESYRSVQAVNEYAST